MKYLFIAFALLAFNTTTFAQHTAPTYSNYIIQDSILIPTRSGVDISAIIVRKETNTTPLPAILFYTTYHQGVGDNIFGKRSADRGFVGIVAYARGIRTDLKNNAPFKHVGTDIFDIIDWISRQS